MLVLTRRVGEEIVIDGQIRVTVVRIEGNKVRLGIVAPPEVQVLRQEIIHTAQSRTDAVACTPRTGDIWNRKNENSLACVSRS